MNKRLRSLIAIAVLLITAGVFVRFFHGHPHYLQQLWHTNHWLMLLIIALYLPFIIILMYVYDACMYLCGLRLELQEKFLLTSYSSVINFFGPLQSGPGVRALYLKTKHGIRLRDYTLATLLYYAIYAFFSALFLLVGTRPWWQTVLALLAVGSVSALVIRFFTKRDREASQSQFRLRGPALAMLIVVTFLQVLMLAIIYFVELKAVHAHVSLGQAMSYTGAANFALFVSLTPGAIGFRESFLVFSEHLHHVSTASIFSANLLDRAAYVILLGLLFLVVISMHANKRLNLKKLRRQVEHR